MIATSGALDCSDSGSDTLAPISQPPGSEITGLSAQQLIERLELGSVPTLTSAMAEPIDEQSADLSSTNSAKYDPSRLFPAASIENFVRVDSKALQKWEGYVVEIADKQFSAHLRDLTNGGSEEEAEISCSDIADDDLPLLRPGAVFYWTIARAIDERTKRPQTISEIRFRRLPQLNPDLYRRIRAQAEKTYQQIQTR